MILVLSIRMMNLMHVKITPAEITLRMLVTRNSNKLMKDDKYDHDFMKNKKDYYMAVIRVNTSLVKHNIGKFCFKCFFNF